VYKKGVYGAIKGRDRGKCRFNKEFYDFLKERRLSMVILIASLLGARMAEICMLRRLVLMQPEALRKVGRPRARWRDEVGKSKIMLGIRTGGQQP
jgi:hypothetical protein